MTRTEAGRDSLPIDVDVVYFLAGPTWNMELIGNRWHFARRWARRVPVVIVQATLPRAAADPRTEPELRIDNCEILHTRRHDDPEAAVETALVQVGDVLNHMALRGYRRPLLWCYDPRLAGLYAALPAERRVYHATENYFDFEGMRRSFLSQVRAACAISDVLVAVSSGVATAIEREAHVPVAVVTNGCDFQLYSAAEPAPELLHASRAFARTAIYAGNVNARLDLSLLNAAAEKHPETYFVFFGRAASLEPTDQREWDQLVARPNASYGGEVPVARLAALYAASDVGLIPYRRERYIVENGFPLKLLEMAATGLPVVASMMKPIVGLAECLRVAPSDEEFVAGVGDLSRRTLRADQREELIRVARENDYDAKFRQVLDLLDQDDGKPSLQTRVDAAISSDASRWREICERWRLDDAHNRKGRLHVGRRQQLRRWLFFQLPKSFRSTMPGSLRRIARTVLPD